ncbi:MAG: hypothetical protein WD990_04115 [Acidimicrobiia bacterium]
MKSRIFLLLTVLAVMLGGTSAIAQETEEDDTPPDANTGFVATISDESLGGEESDNDETLYIRYHVCSLNVEADDSCEETLADFDPETFTGWTEIVVEPNEAGEINHGSFVSAFAQEFEGGPGKGCVLRFIAQSDWGKDEVNLESDGLLIEADTFCAFNKTDGGDEEAEGEEAEGNGPPAWAGKGKPDWAGDGEDSESSDEDAGGPPPWAGSPGGPKGANG